MAQVEVINGYMDALKTRKPIFLTGDFNAVPDSELISTMKESWTLISQLDRTYPSERPVKCIDYIFVRQYGDVVTVVDNTNPDLTPEQAAASDHLPVKVSVRIR